MKITHKRAPSGMENSSLLQNTERIVVQKKQFPQPNTTKRQGVHKEQLYQILQEGEILPLYESFISFHLQLQDLLEVGNIQEVKNCCLSFKQAFKQMWMTQDNGTEVSGSMPLDDDDSMLSADQAEKIKELLEEIYYLRQKVADLDGSLNLDSISSLEDCNIEASKQKSRERDTSSRRRRRYQVEKPVARTEAQGQQELEAINNYIQLKTLTFQIASLSWRIIEQQMPEDSYYLLEQIKECYRFETEHYLCQQHPGLAAGSLDRISNLVLVMRALAFRTCNPEVRARQVQISIL